MGFYNIPVYAALLCIIARLLLFSFGPESGWLDHGIRLFYLLVLLIALMWGIVRHRKRFAGEPSFGTEVKAGMKVGSVFVLLIALFTYVFYRFVNPAYFQEKIHTILKSAQGRTTTELENIQATSEFVFSPFTHATATLFIGLLIGFLYTLLMVALVRMKPELFR